jgi:hypothetical protein
MNKGTQIILSVGLFLGLVSTSFAANMSKDFVSNSNQRLQNYQTMVSAKTTLRYSGTLLERSTVAQKLKFSGNSSEQAHYAKAMAIYQEAKKAYEAGNDTDAKKLSLEAIRVIASTVPRHYRRVAELDQ